LCLALLQYFSWTSFLLSTNFQIPFFQPIVVWFPLYNKSLLPITCTINERAVVVAVSITMVQAKYNWSQLIMLYKKKRKKALKHFNLFQATHHHQHSFFSRLLISWPPRACLDELAAREFSKTLLFDHTIPTPRILWMDKKCLQKCTIKSSSTYRTHLVCCCKYTTHLGFCDHLKKRLLLFFDYVYNYLVTKITK